MPYAPYGRSGYPTVGVQLVVKGADAFQSAARMVQQEVARLSRSGRMAAGDLQALGPQMDTLGLAMGGLGAVAMKLSQDILMVAARNEELALAVQQMGKLAGYSETQLAQYENEIKSMGIQTREAREMMLLFMQSEIDLADAAKLARTAQDLAVIGMVNSSEAARDLAYAIASGNTFLLRKYGLTARLTEVLDRYHQATGQATGTVIDHTEAISDSEREIAQMTEKLQFLKDEMAYAIANNYWDTKTLLARKHAIEDLEDKLDDETRKLAQLRAEHGKLREAKHKALADYTEEERRQAILNYILEEGIKVQGLYQIAMQTFGKEVRSLPRYIHEASNALGRWLIPSAYRLFKVVRDFLINIPKLPPEVQKVTAFLLAFAGVVGTLGGTFLLLLPRMERVAAALQNLPAILQAVKAAILGPTLGPLLLLVGALGTLYIAWVQNWGGIRDFTNEVTAGLRYAFYAITGQWDKLADDAEASAYTLTGVAPMVAHQVQEAFRRMAEAFGPVRLAWERLGEVVEWAFAPLLRYLYDALGPIGSFRDLFVTAFTVVTQAIATLAEWLAVRLADALMAVAMHIRPLRQAAWDLVGSFRDIAPVVLSAVQAVVDFLSANIPRALATLQEVWTTAWSTLQGVWTTVLDALRGAWDTWAPVILEAAQRIGDFFQTALPQVLAALQTLWTNAMSALRGAWDTWGPVILDVGQRLGDFFASALPQALTTLQTLWTSVSSALRNAWDTWGPVVLAAGQNIGDFFRTVLPQALTTLQTLWTNVMSALRTAWDTWGPVVLQVAQGVAQALREHLPRALQFLSGVADTVLGALSQVWNTWGTQVTSVLQTVAGWVSQKVPAALMTLREALSALPQIWEGVRLKVLALRMGFEQFYRAAQPVVQGLANFFAPTFQRLRDSLKETAEKLGPLKDAFLRFGKAVLPIAEKVAVVVGAVLVLAFRVILEVVSAVLPTLVELATNLLNAWADIFEGINQVLDGFIQFFSSVFRGDLEGAAKAISGVVEGFKKVLLGLFRGVLSGARTILGGLGRVLRNLFGDAFRPLVQETLPREWGKVTGWFTRGFNTLRMHLTDEVTRIQSSLERLGRDIVEGIKRGIEERFRAIIEGIAGWFNRLIRAGKETLDVMGDPYSIAFERIGLAVVEGLRKGVLENIMLVLRALQRLFAGMDEKAKESLKDTLDILSKLDEAIASVLQAFRLLGRAGLGEGPERVVSDWKQHLRAFTEDLRVLLRALVRLASHFSKESLEAVKLLVDTFGSFGTAVSSALEALDLLSEFGGRMDTLDRDFRRGVRTFVAMMKVVVTAFAAAGKGFRVEALFAAKEFAAAVGEISDQLRKGLEGLAALQEFQPRPIARALHAAVRQLGLVVEAFAKAAAAYKQQAKPAWEDAKAFAEVMGAIAAQLNAMVEGLQALRAFQAVPAVRKKAERLAEQVGKVVEAFAKAAALFGAGAEEARQFATLAHEITQTLADAIHALTALADWVPRPVREQAAALTEALLDLVLQFRDAASRLSAEGLKLASEFGEAVKPVSEGVQAAVAALTALGAWAPQALEGAIDRLVDLLLVAVRRFAEAGAQFREEALAQATAFAHAVKDVLEALSAAVGALAQIGDTVWSVTAEQLDRLAAAAYEALTAFVKVAQAFHRLHGEGAATVLQEVQAFAKALGELFGVLGHVVEGLEQLDHVGADLSHVQDAADRLARAAFQVLEAFQKVAHAFFLLHGELAETLLQRTVALVKAVSDVGNALKGVLEAVTVLVGAEVPATLGGLADRLAAVAAELVAAFQRAAEAFSQEGLAAATQFAAAANTVMGIIKTAVEGVQAAWSYTGDISSIAAEMLAQDVAAFVRAFAQAAAAFEEEGLAAASAFATAANAVMGLVKGTVDALVAAATVTAAQAEQALAHVHDLQAFVAQVVAAFQDAAAWFSSQGLAAAVEFAAAAEQAFRAARSALDFLSSLAKYVAPAEAKVHAFLEGVRTVVARVIEALEVIFHLGARPEVPSPLDMLAAGYQITLTWIRGMVNGVAAGSAELLAAIRRLVEAAVRTAAEGLGVASPSEQFEQMGWDTVQGLVNGMLKAARDALQAIEAIVKALVGTVEQDPARGKGSVWYQAGKDSADLWFQGLADGLKERLPDVAKVLEVLREYFPSSPAKRGPLRRAPDWSSYLTFGLDRAVRLVDAHLGGMPSNRFSQAYQPVQISYAHYWSPQFHVTAHYAAPQSPRTLREDLKLLLAVERQMR